MAELTRKQEEAYYEEQLKKISTDLEYPAQIKLVTTVDKTNWMGLNEYSVAVLIKWLTKNYIGKKNETTKI